MSQQALSIKMVIVGDGSVGKTCVLISYTSDRFPTQYVPTVFENYAATIKVDNINVNLGLWDTAGQEQYARLRPLAYGHCDVFLITFSVIDPASFRNAKNKWYKQLEQYAPNVPKIFIGNKIDLRQTARKNAKSQKDRPIQYQVAKKILTQQTKGRYFECSALTQQGLKEIFIEAMRTVIKQKGRGSSTRKSQDQQCKLCQTCNLM